MTTTTPKPRLRWYQYSLRSLFVLTVLVAIGGSWFAWKKQQVERQRAAAKAIEETGGSVWYDYERQYLRSPAQSASPEPPGPAWLRDWLGDDFFAHVETVNLPDKPVTDATWEHIKVLTQLKVLCLHSTPVTDAGLEQLKGLPKLQHLAFHRTPVTDSALAHLEGLPQLKKLTLDSTSVTDAGLEHLKGLPRLEVLDLRTSHWTDVGFTYVPELPELQDLNRDRSKVTDEGVKRLQEALPNCEIVR